MLCAQHALNVLLQNQYFSPVDLAEIAKSLEEVERQNMIFHGIDPSIRVCLVIVNNLCTKNNIGNCFNYRERIHNISMTVVISLLK